MNTQACLIALSVFLMVPAAWSQACSHREALFSSFKIENGKRTDKKMVKNKDREIHYDGPGIIVQVHPKGYSFKKGTEGFKTVTGKLVMADVGLGAATMLGGPQPQTTGSKGPEAIVKTGQKKTIAGVACEVYSVRQPMARTPDAKTHDVVDERCLSFDQPAAYFKNHPEKAAETNVFLKGLALERKIMTTVELKDGAKMEDTFAVTTTVADATCPPANLTSVPAGTQEFKIPGR